MGFCCVKLCGSKPILILMLGLKGAGKSTLVHGIKFWETTKIPPPIGFSVETLIYQGFGLSIWDIDEQIKIGYYGSDIMPKLMVLF